MNTKQEHLIRAIAAITFFIATAQESICTPPGFANLESQEAKQVTSGIIPIPGISDNRIINWTETGVPGGIPERTTIFSRIDSVTFGDGTNDAATAIQDAIDACPTGQVVYIPEGTYRLNSQLTIAKGIVLRGAGPTKTILKTYAEWHGIQMGDWPSPPAATDVSGNPVKGDNTLTLANASSFAVGDYIVIDQKDDGVEVINVDDQSRDGNTRSLSQMTKITGIDGTTLTIHPPLYHNYVSEQNPQVWKIKSESAMTTYAGVEDLCIERISPTGWDGFSNIKMVACAYSWVKNIESKMAQFRHVDVDRSFRNTIRDNYFNDGMHHGTGGFAYGVVCANRSTDNLTENNIFFHLRHSMVIKEGAAGNVFGYNYSVDSYQGENWLAADINAHGAHSHMNLFEGNVVCKMYADFTHGSSSYNTFFRNESRRESSAQSITLALRAVDLEKVQYFYNIIGNVLGKSGQDWTAFEDDGTRSSSEKYVYTWGYPSDGAGTSTDPQTKATAIRHGNYDYFTETVNWDPTIAEHNFPNSLYLTAKPAWYPDGFEWPAIGPDVSNYATKIPAEKRYEDISATPAAKPEINSLLQKSGTTCSSFLYTITASNIPTSFNASPLPDGLSVNTQTGVISGNPVTAGTTNVTIEATNSLGKDTKTLVITIGETISIWEPADTPATASHADNDAIEVGVKFKSDVPGAITAIRFYKGPTNTGTHAGSLWKQDGTKLAQVTFTGETASGWQQANFATPVPIEANTIYVASYHAPMGNYAANSNGLLNGKDNAPLHAVANAESVNGIYLYTTASAFPTETFNATNYWIDVVFKCSAATGVVRKPLTTVPSVAVYPNPANNEIKVVTDQNTSHPSIITIFDCRGTEVFSKTINGREERIRLSAFQAGVYLLKWRADEAVSTKKFVVQH